MKNTFKKYASSACALALSLSALLSGDSGPDSRDIILENTGNPYDLSEEIRRIADFVEKAVKEEAAKGDQGRIVYVPIGETHPEPADIMVELGVIQALQKYNPMVTRELAHNLKSTPFSIDFAPVTSWFFYNTLADNKIPVLFNDAANHANLNYLDQQNPLTRQAIIDYNPDLLNTDISFMSPSGIAVRNHIMVNLALSKAHSTDHKLIISFVGNLHLYGDRKMKFPFKESVVAYAPKHVRVIPVSLEDSEAVYNKAPPEAFENKNMLRIFVDNLPKDQFFTPASTSELFYISNLRKAKNSSPALNRLLEDEETRANDEEKFIIKIVKASGMKIPDYLPSPYEAYISPPPPF